MTYTELIETISSIVDNEKINKLGLSLLYELDDKSHREINESIHYKMNPYSVDFKPSDEFEVVLGGILIKFSKLK